MRNLTHPSAAPKDPHGPAEVLASRLLTRVETRWAHSATVAKHAAVVVAYVPAEWRAALTDAAWLHDIGRSPEIAVTGFHPLDGARWLRDAGWPETVCRLVAWHSEPLPEARLRGRASSLTTEFDRPPALPLAALTWADMTTSPSGETCPAEERLSEILDRYPPDSIAHQATTESAPELRVAVRMIEDLIEGRS